MRETTTSCPRCGSKRKNSGYPSFALYCPKCGLVEIKKACPRVEPRERLPQELMDKLIDAYERQ